MLQVGLHRKFDAKQRKPTAGFVNSFIALTKLFFAYTDFF